MLIHAAAEARRFLEKFGISSPDDIVLEDMAEYEDVEVKYAHLDNADAHLVRVGEVGSITVSDRLQPRGSQRFAIAHELGHWCLHRGECQEFFCSAEAMREYRNSGLELEANTFASELLIPKFLVPVSMVKGEPTWSAIQQLSETFGVTHVAAAVRYVDLIDHATIAVISDGRNVRWWRENRRRTGGLWLESAQLIEADSIAYHAADVGGAEPRLQEVPWDAWFPHIRSGRDTELFEVSATVGDEGVVLTLLWAPCWS